MYLNFGGKVITDQEVLKFLAQSKLSYFSRRTKRIIHLSGLLFDSHISCVTENSGVVMINLLRSTFCRYAEFMLTLYVSHVCPIIGY